MHPGGLHPTYRFMDRYKDVNWIASIGGTHIKKGDGSKSSHSERHDKYPYGGFLMPFESKAGFYRILKTFHITACILFLSPIIWYFESR